MNIDDIINESSLSRIMEMWKLHATGTITAFRGSFDCGDGEKITMSANKGRNSVLKSSLLGSGFGVTKVKGSWIENGSKEVGEESFFVVDLKDSGMLKKILRQLGEKFEQDAITYADKESEYSAIGTNRCPNSWPGYGKSEVLGKPIFGRTGINGFSRVNGRAFVFEGAGEIITKLDYFPSEIRSISNIDKLYPDIDSIKTIK